jgi:steroid 5-alpha reductase family enzyme
MTRAAMLFAGVWFWSLRLTGNWLKKGGLRFEDFRYVRFRQTMSPLVFKLFSFVVLFELQIAMVLSMCMPAWYALRAPGRDVNALDGLALAIVVAGVIFEWIADVQGMAFRARREAHRKRAPADLEGSSPAYPRFPQEGLWRWSRHPNYFGEICVWWGVYLFAVAASGEWLNWTIVGPLTINGLFLGGSIGITEAHELRRKPEYADYQRRTSRLIPWLPGR